MAVLRQAYAKYAKSFSDVTLLTPQDNPVMEMLLSPFGAVKKTGRGWATGAPRRAHLEVVALECSPVCEPPGLGGHTPCGVSALVGPLWRPLQKSPSVQRPVGGLSKLLIFMDSD